MDFTSLTIGAIIGMVIGCVCLYLINHFALKSKRERIIDEAQKEAEVIKKNKFS